MRARLVGAAGVLAAAAGLVWPVGAGAADVATGWWHVLRQQTPVGALPAAPVADAGSLPVQNGPSGVLAYSAIRYDAGSAAGVTVTLTFTATAVSTPVVDACPVTAGWQPGADQTWDRRPSYDCHVHVAGEANGSQMTWQLGSLVRSGRVDVALVPDAADPTPYSISFRPPTAASFLVTPQAAPAPGTSPAAPPVASSGGGSAGTVPAGSAAASAPAGASGAAPVVAGPASATALPVGGAAPAEAAPRFGSRAVCAAILAAVAAALLVRGLAPGRARPGRSLLARG